MKPAVSPHEARQVATIRAFFLDLRGPEATAAREAFIASLPLVWWKGKPLRTIRCTGERGRGPHDVNVPESLLWALIDLGRYRCPFHA